MTARRWPGPRPVPWRGRAFDLALDLLVLAGALLLVLPAFLHAGLGLAGDLVFSPRQPLTADTVGLGERLPRAVPLDALTALAGAVVPGAVLFRLAVLAGAVLAGTAVHRLLGDRGTAARAVAAIVAVWNPFVVERLALGQWALVLGYGATCWVVLATVRWRASSATVPWAAWAWLGVASCTPTGGLLALVTALAVGVERRRRSWVLLAGGVVLQLPWVLPSLLADGGGTSDPVGLWAFRATADGPGGVLVSLLGLGGIWDLLSVPSSRGSVLGPLAATLAVAAVALAVRRLPSGVARLVPLAAASLLLALAPRVPGLDDVVARVVQDVPGGGLLRDSQKWIVPWVLLVAVSAGVALERVTGWVRSRDQGLAAVVGLVGVVLPFVVLPDATSATWPTVTPVRYPRDFDEVRAALADDPDEVGRHRDHGGLVLLPLRAYRAFEWGGDRTAYDPAYAWFDVPLVGSTALPVGDRVVADDDPQEVARVEAALAGADPAAALARLGIGWALVYRDDPDAPRVRLDGLDLVVAGDDLLLYRVPGAVASRSGPGTVASALVVGVDLAVLLSWVIACVLALWRPSPGNLPASRIRRGNRALGR